MMMVKPFPHNGSSLPVQFVRSEASLRFIVLSDMTGSAPPPAGPSLCLITYIVGRWRRITLLFPFITPPAAAKGWFPG